MVIILLLGLLRLARTGDSSFRGDNSFLAVIHALGHYFGVSGLTGDSRGQGYCEQTRLGSEVETQTFTQDSTRVCHKQA